MTTILLVRHGESEANRLGFFAGQTDAALLEKGIEQAKATGTYIAQNYTIDKVYASDLRRAYKTGEEIAKLTEAPLIADNRLREINAGLWQGRKFDDLLIRYHESYTCWLQDIGNCRCDGGESIQQLSQRVCEVLTEIAQANPGKTVVVATHATPIRAMQCILKGLPLDEMKHIPWVSNASVTELTYANAAWQFIQEGEDRFLSELKTSFPPNV